MTDPAGHWGDFLQEPKSKHEESPKAPKNSQFE
jgi:hypothetical protein